MTVEREGEAGQDEVGLVNVLGWAAVFVVPVAVHLYVSGRYADTRKVDYLSVLAVAVVMWMFRLVPEHVPAVFVMLTAIILGAAPAPVVLSGFASGSFVLAMSVFAIGALLVRSGLTRRVALGLLARVPSTQLSHEASMLLIGLLFTPVLPSANGRVALLFPVLDDITEHAGYPRGSVAATRIAAATFTGATGFSAVFLSSKSINFVVHDLLDPQLKTQFTWGYWAFAATVAGLTLLAGHAALSWLLFRNDMAPQLSKISLRRRLIALGPISRDELLALLAMGVFLLGTLTTSLHKIDPSWIGLMGFFLLISLGALSKTDIRREIDWPFLMILAGMVSIAKTMSELGLDDDLGRHLAWMGAYMRDAPATFVLLLMLTTFVVRLALPINAAIMLLATLFLPIAENEGVNSWIIAFSVLILAEGWFLAYQCSYYTAFQGSAEARGAPLFNRRRMLAYAALTNVVRVAAIFASLPFWRSLGLL